MNKYALHVAGGALLATTALASGTVHAAVIRVLQASPGIGVVAAGAEIAAASVPVAASAFTSTGSAITVGPATIIVDTTSGQNSFSGTQTTIQLNVTGAEFASTVPDVRIFGQETTASGSLTTITTVGAVPFVASDRITLNNVTGVTFGVLVFSGVQFRNAQALATAGNTVSLSGTILNSSGVLTIETITSATFLVSRAAASIQVSAGGAASITNTSSPQFSTVSQAGAVSTNVVLSNINFSDANTGFGANLSTTQSIAGLISTYEVKLTHAALSDPATATVNYINAAPGTGTVARTPAQFVSGSVSFTITPTAGGESTATRTLAIVFNGSTAISNASAGTTVVTPTTRTAATGVAAGSGTAAALNRGGMNAIVNYFQPSNNSIQSFLRVSNTGTTAGAVTVTVRNSSNGTSIGSYVSSSVSAGGTIQISGSTIEGQSSPVITPVVGVPYDLTVSGAITGFVQHIGFNTVSGQLSDLSGFRKGSSGYND